MAGSSFHHLGAGLELLNFSLHHVHSSFTVLIFLLSHGKAASGFPINMSVTSAGVFFNGLVQTQQMRILYMAKLSAPFWFYCCHNL